jgi:hypothetical protein
MDRRVIIYIISVLLFSTIFVNGQILKPTFLNYEIDSLTKNQIFVQLDTLFVQINENRLDKILIGKDPTDFNPLKSFFKIEDNKKDSIPNFYKKQLINIYPISRNEFWLSIAFIGQKDGEIPILKSIINLIATKSDKNVVFAIPTKYLTKSWKLSIIGNITYYHRGKLNLIRAKKFNAKNTLIAQKLGQKPEKLNFYMCNNYQEILQLLGYEYELESNGKTRDGYGVDGNTVFSTMNNEDFSHDVFHYYTGKFRQQIPANGIVEEGIAYSWGNAYYTNKNNGEMIEQKELVQILKKYLQNNPSVNLFELFIRNTKIYNNLANEISVKSTISSLICDEVERKKGIEGLRLLIKCGKGSDSFFKAIDDLISLNKTNFNNELKRLITQY